MKKLLRAFAMAQSMFCAIPCPWKVWDEAARPYMLLFLPVIGLELGALWAGLAWLAAFWRLPALITGLILCAYPYGVTGFLHLDGFMDVTDAVRSCRDLDRRREILKDPHVGAFGVIGCVLVWLTGFACFGSGSGDPLILLFVPAVSRCCSALGVTMLKPMASSQYAKQTFSGAHAGILMGMLAICLISGFLLAGKYGFVLLIETAACNLALLRGTRALGGMNGDISGYALTLGELCAAAAYAFL